MPFCIFSALYSLCAKLVYVFIHGVLPIIRMPCQNTKILLNQRFLKITKNTINKSEYLSLCNKEIYSLFSTNSRRDCNQNSIKSLYCNKECNLTSQVKPSASNCDFHESSLSPPISSVACRPIRLSSG